MSKDKENRLEFLKELEPEVMQLVSKVIEIEKENMHYLRVPAHVKDEIAGTVKGIVK